MKQKETTLQQLEKVRNRAIKIIREALNKAPKKTIKIGDTIDSDELYNLPCAINVSKHWFYSEYGIHTVKLNKHKQIVFIGIEKGENSDEREFSQGDLYVSDVCQVADMIEEKK